MNDLATAADLAQFYSLFLLLKDASNSEIMRELQTQDTKYFEDIIQRLERIEKRIGKIEELASYRSYITTQVSKNIGEKNGD